ncbi:MAG: hypothetical protein IKV76_00190 [Clostridia bacterium]|nr:hypothetical protein [Clostridia bacterium]
MYSNIGKKIQRLAAISAIIGMIASIAIGFALIVLSDGGWLGTNETLIVIGVAVIILGSILSWVLSFVLYGFGRLVENSEIIARQFRKNAGEEPCVPEEPSQPLSQTIRKVMDKGAIAAKTIYDKSGQFIGNQAQKAQARRENAAQQPQQYAQRPAQPAQRPVQPMQSQMNYDDIYSSAATTSSDSKTESDSGVDLDFDFLNL